MADLGPMLTRIADCNQKDNDISLRMGLIQYQNLNILALFQIIRCQVADVNFTPRLSRNRA